MSNNGHIRNSIIILNFNGRHFLDDCLQSVLLQRTGDTEIILVDNGSTDGSVPYVVERYPEVRIIRSDKNLGFAGGNNLGVRYANGQIMVLLNNDTIVAEGWLSALLQALQPDDVAIASSFVITDGIPERYYDSNGSMNLLGHNIMRIMRNPQNQFYASGTSLAYKKNILGLPFDPDYFAYHEDVYLSMRARFLGYRVVNVRASQVVHRGGATTKKLVPGWILFLQERNRLLTLALFFSSKTLWKLSPYFICNLIAKTCGALFSTRFQFHATGKAYWWMLTHGSLIKGKRNSLRAEKRIPEQEVLSWATAKLTNGESLAGKAANALSVFYCRCARLKTIEFVKDELR